MNNPTVLQKSIRLFQSVKKKEIEILMKEFEPCEITNPIPEGCILVVPVELHKIAVEVHKAEISVRFGEVFCKVRFSQFLSPVCGGNGKCYLLAEDYGRKDSPFDL